MAADFDGPPIYDELVKPGNLMSDIWIAWISTFGQTLAGYLGQYGMFVPQVTTAQRNTIQSPQLGQMIYNTTTNELQVWQIKAGNALWRSVNTTP